MILDFDGTVVDVWQRYYRVFIDYWHLPELCVEDYKLLKRRYKNDKELIKNCFETQDSEKVKGYYAFKHRNLESEEYLKLDCLLIDPEKLRNFMLKYDSMVLSIRRHPNVFYDVLKFHNLDFLADSSVVLSDLRLESKKLWVEQQQWSNEKIIVVGDSETDLYIGNLPNVRVCFVKTGLRDKFGITIKKNEMTFDNIEDTLFWIEKTYDTEVNYI